MHLGLHAVINKVSLIQGHQYNLPAAIILT